MRQGACAPSTCCRGQGCGRQAIPPILLPDDWLWCVLSGIGLVALGSALVVLFLVLDGLDSDLPIYIGLAGSLIAYVAVSLGSGPRPSTIGGANK